MGLEVTASCIAKFEDGREFTVERLSSETPIENRSGNYQVKSEPIYQTDDGHAVRRESKGVYFVIIDGEEIRATCDDPNAV